MGQARRLGARLETGRVRLSRGAQQVRDGQAEGKREIRQRDSRKSKYLTSQVPKARHPLPVPPPQGTLSGVTSPSPISLRSSSPFGCWSAHMRRGVRLPGGTYRRFWKRL